MALPGIRTHSTDGLIEEYYKQEGEVRLEEEDDAVAWGESIQVVVVILRLSHSSDGMHGPVTVKITKDMEDQTSQGMRSNKPLYLSINDEFP